MKTTILILLLTSFGLWAQTPPAPGAGAANRDEILRDALRRAITDETNTSAATAAPAPSIPGAAAPSATVPAAAVPGAAIPAVPALPPGPAAPAPTPAPAAAPAEQEEILPAGFINFTSVDINQALQVYADLVGRTVLRPASLGAGQIVLRTQTPLTKKEAVQALEAVLSLSGISLINVGDKFVKAVTVGEANQAGAALDRREAEKLPDMGSYVTHILQVTNAKPSELQPVLQYFAKLPNSIIPIDSSGILVLRDNAENVKRMLEMIKELDVTVPAEFLNEVIPIKYALASEIQSALSSLGGGGGGSVGRSSARTPAPAAARPGMPNTGGINQPGQPPQPLGATPSGTPSSTSTYTDRLRNIINRASSSTSSGEIQILGQTKIIADERTNSLLVFATRQDMAMIKDIVSKLDVVLAQVLIETIIMDVSMGDTWALGVSAAQRPKDFTPTFTGAGGYNNSQQFFNWLNSVTTNGFPGNTTAVLPPGLSYFGKFSDTWDVALQAAAGDTRVNVIQKPRIQTSHATPASLFIGSTVPYVSSTYYGGGYAGGPSSSYQQLKVGINMQVTPFINPDGLVVMKIDESIDEISGSTKIDGNDVPETTSRTLSAEVAVRDRETIILGGFIRNSDNQSKSGVPLLKDIPLLGALFSAKSSTKQRTELIVLMRPTVLKTPELAALQVDVEKKRLPGVLRAEKEIGTAERKAIDAEPKQP